MSKNYELDQKFLAEYHKYFDIKTQNNVTLYVCILCNDGYIDAIGANLGIILEKCYLSIYQLLNA
jgi:hypothetical protein